MSTEALQAAVKRILDVNLAMAKDESYLFFTDSNSRWESDQDAMVARREYLHMLYERFLDVSAVYCNVRHDKYEATRRHGAEPRENIWRLAFGERVYSWLVETDLLWRLKEGADIASAEEQGLNDILRRHHDDVVKCVVAFPWYSTTHTRFRRLLNAQGCRYVSMPMLTRTVMEGPMMADWQDVASRTDRVYAVLTEAESLHVQSPAGTDLALQVGVRSQIHKDAGDFSANGAFGNLPAGEAYLVPKSKTAQGRIAFTSAPGKAWIEPTVAIIEQGNVSRFESDTPYSVEMDAKFDRDFAMRHIAELGIGTNPLAKDVSSMIEGEKICGTVHVALGSDKAIGGTVEASEHLDHIIINPTLVARMRGGGSTVIIDNGALMI